MNSVESAGLTAREKEVLHLVAQLRTSKAIATRLGIEPDSVDKRLKRAMKKLGVGNRHVAAQMLLSHESLALSQDRDSIAESANVSPSLPVDIAAPSGILGPSALDREYRLELQEDRVPFVHQASITAMARRWTPWIPSFLQALVRTGEGNGLTVDRRAKIIFQIASATILLLAGAALAMMIFAFALREIRGQQPISEHRQHDAKERHDGIDGGSISSS